MTGGGGGAFPLFDKELAPGARCVLATGEPGEARRDLEVGGGDTATHIPMFIPRVHWICHSDPSAEGDESVLWHERYGFLGRCAPSE